jgi:hypothetical protein
VSSIFTAMVGLFGTRPMPVNGFFAGRGFGFGFGLVDLELLLDGAEGAGEDDELDLWSPVHAAPASNTVAAIDAAKAWRVRVMGDPLS